MPLIERSGYKAPYYLINAHVETVVPSVFRKIRLPCYQREKILTGDGDFINLDWIRNNSNRLVFLLHGLEGDSTRPYIKGMARIFSDNGWDVVAWNCRSCGQEMNATYKMYHHGATEDTVAHLVQSNAYQDIAMVGFSMGGAQTVKFLGENAGALAQNIKAAVVFSVPFNLGNSAKSLSKWENGFYRRRFFKKVESKSDDKGVAVPILLQYI